MSFESFVARRYFAMSGALALIARTFILILALLLAVIAVRYLFPSGTYLALILAMLCLLVVFVRYLLTFRSHVALISTISVLGLAVGVTALVISLALLSGFQDRIRAQMAQRSPHLVVSPARGDRLADAGRVARVLSSLPGVLKVAPAIEGRGWLCDAEGHTVVPVRYRNATRGLSPASGGAAGPPPTRITLHVAARTGSETGSLVRLVSSRTRLSPIGPIPVSVVLRVVETFRPSALEKTPEVEIPEETARLLSGMVSGARAFEAHLKDPESAGAAAALVARQLPPSDRVETWRDLNAPLSFALHLEKAVIFATVALVILVAAFNIVSNIALLVVEKKRDLGVLASLGATPGSLARIYLMLGAIIGALGTTCGIAVGVPASELLDRFRLVPLPADVYLLTHVPFAVHPLEVILVVVFAQATALAAAVLPARAGARLAPGEALRLSR
ncbi:MAG: FtsX-like permease family protein [Thermoanaerobaculia bacterium]